jgi:hypothetical protein
VVGIGVKGGMGLAINFPNWGDTVVGTGICLAGTDRAKVVSWADPRIGKNLTANPRVTDRIVIVLISIFSVTAVASLQPGGPMVLRGHGNAVSSS